MIYAVTNSANGSTVASCLSYECVTILLFAAMSAQNGLTTLTGNVTETFIVFFVQEPLYSLAKASFDLDAPHAEQTRVCVSPSGSMNELLIKRARRRLAIFSPWLHLKPQTGRCFLHSEHVYTLSVSFLDGIHRWQVPVAISPVSSVPKIHSFVKSPQGKVFLHSLQQSFAYSSCAPM